MTMTTKERDRLRKALSVYVEGAPIAPEWQDWNVQRAVPDRPRRFLTSPVVALVAATLLVLVVLGGSTLLLRGNVPEVVGQPGTTIAVSPEVTTATESPSPATTVPEDPSQVVPVPSLGAGVLGNNGMNDGPWVFSNAAGSFGAFVTWFEVGEPPVLHVDVVECASDGCSSVVRTRLEGLTGVEHWPTSRPLVLSDGSWAWVSGNELVVCDDSVCATTSRITLADDVFGGNAALTDDGRPVFVLALNDPPGSGAAVVVCGDVRCETGSPGRAILDDVAVPLPFSALAIDRGRLAYAYRDPDSAALHLVTCGDLGCANPISVEVVPPIGDSEKGWPDVFSLAVGSDGLPVLAYGLMGEPRQLRVVHCENWACTELSDTAVSELHGFWQGPSLAIGSDGNPVMAFQSNDRITVLKCEDVTCTRTTISYPLGETPGDPSLVIGSDGNPIIAFFPPIPSEDEEAGTDPAAGMEFMGDDPVLFRCLDLACTEPSE